MQCQLCYGFWRARIPSSRKAGHVPGQGRNPRPLISVKQGPRLHPELPLIGHGRHQAVCSATDIGDKAGCMHLLAVFVPSPFLLLPQFHLGPKTLSLQPVKKQISA